MDYPIERKKGNPPKKPKKVKTAKPSIFKTIKTTAQQWWKPSNQTPLQPTQPVDDTSSTMFLDQEFHKKMTIDSVDSTTSSSEDDKVLFNNRSPLLRKRLFLIEEENPKLYEDAYNRFINFETECAQYNTTKVFSPNIKEPKLVHQPTTQLSHDGLALMSHLYAQKDGSQKQPIVIKTFEGFEKIIRFIYASPSDIDITMIIQFEKSAIDILGKDIHKISMKLEKVDSKIHAIYLDSVSASNTLLFATMKLTSIMNQLQLENSKEKTSLHTHLQNDFFDRQNDKFQCAVFATKDARELNRDDTSKFISQNTSEKNLQHHYDIPAKYFKGVQSRQTQEAMLAQFGDEIVTRDNCTLKKVYDKHPNQSYIPHFSKKYETLVMTCANSLTDAQLDEAIGNYSAETITPERLQAVYGSNASVKKA